MKILEFKRFIGEFCIIALIVISVFTSWHDQASASAMAPVVESFKALNNDPENLTDLRLKIKFSQPMDRKSVESATTLILSGVRIVPFTASWKDGYTVLLKPAGLTEMHLMVAIIIGNKASSVDGMEMKDAYNRYIVTALANPTIKRTEPDNNSKCHPVNGSIKIFFSQAMDQYSSEVVFSLKAEGRSGVVSGKVLWTENSACMIFAPDNDFEMGKWYVCTISTAAKDIFGQSMLDTYTFRFLTG